MVTTVLAVSVLPRATVPLQGNAGLVRDQRPPNDPDAGMLYRTDAIDKQ